MTSARRSPSTDERWPRLTRRRTLRQAGAGVPARGAKLELPGICLAHVVDGKAVEYWSQFDQLAALRQAGLFSLDAIAG